jgi:exopolysaccharide production protein ExoY
MREKCSTCGRVLVRKPQTMGVFFRAGQVGLQFPIVPSGLGGCGKMVAGVSFSGQVSRTQSQPPPPPPPLRAKPPTPLRAASVPKASPTAAPACGTVAALAFAGPADSLCGTTSARPAARPADPLPQRLPKAQPLGGLAKRAVDVALAGLLLILSAPIMLLIAAAIQLSMGGPAVFGHRRVGYRGRSFVCYKFRTMASNAQELLDRHLAESPEAAREWQATRKLSNDPRVTRLGRILRKTSLDELPQLLNVLAGDMSLIGPRPIVPDEMVRYGRHLQAYLCARPGITGVWQTNGRSSVSYRTRVACDRCYARHWSLRRDLGLLLKTIPAVLKFDQTS